MGKGLCTCVEDKRGSCCHKLRNDYKYNYFALNYFVNNRPSAALYRKH